MAPRAYSATGGDCYLPDCGVTVTGGPISGGFGFDPFSSFGDTQGSGGGYPRAFPQFSGKPQTPVPKGPVFTPKPVREPPAQAAPPPSQPPKPPPPTPVGEPPIDEPPYSTYDPNVFEKYHQPSPLERLMRALFPEGIDYMLASKILSGAGDLFNLLTYSADAGLSQEEEAARVQATLASIPPGGLPYADPLRVTLDASIQAGADAAAPNIERLFNPVGELAPSLATVTVSASRPRSTTAALVEPNLAVIPASLQSGRLASPLAALATLTGLQLNTVTQPVGRISPTSRLRPGVARPELLPGRGLVSGISPGMNPRLSPDEGTQPGVAPSQTDCQATQTKQKNKKRKKRTVCYRGTYEERANGLLKWRKVRIQCR